MDTVAGKTGFGAVRNVAVFNNVSCVRLCIGLIKAVLAAGLRPFEVV
jgi:hypothetical protein